MDRNTAKPHEEEWEDPYPQKSRSMHWMSVVLLLSVFYVMSVGPMSKLAQHKVIDWKTVTTIYAPLDAACMRITPLDRAVQWWIRSVWNVRSGNR